ncbi:hypothetical protein GCM10010256_74690 [Streptomyces coeruleorubidus]|nr:hypothetical protein GCM10010256_74690 [Streptomyces coeruleorubidus]
MYVEALPRSAVRLPPGPFLDAQATALGYLLSLDTDRLLAPLRREAGLPPVAESYGNWENSGLDGHTLGHALSGAALMSAVTDDPGQKPWSNVWLRASSSARRLWAPVTSGAFPTARGCGSEWPRARWSGARSSSVVPGCGGRYPPLDPDRHAGTAEIRFEAVGSGTTFRLREVRLVR